jgi:pyruvate dehydrogenase E2 component (dihydrolipoamide acetyltransferase)
MPEITMPRLSDTMEEGTISRWLKQPGDTIQKGDILGEIETDKATMDLEAYEAGVLEQILVPAGETVPIGQPIAMIGTGAGTIAAPALKQGQPTKAVQASASSTLEALPAPAVSAPRESAAAGDGAAAVKASPLARRLAEEHNIDLRQLQGTGPGGRIVRDDIEEVLEQRTAPAAAAQAAPAPVPPPSAPPPEAERVKLSRVQLLIARRLTESKQTIPLRCAMSSQVTRLLRRSTRIQHLVRGCARRSWQRRGVRSISRPNNQHEQSEQTSIHFQRRWLT